MKFSRGVRGDGAGPLQPVKNSPVAEIQQPIQGAQTLIDGVALQLTYIYFDSPHDGSYAIVCIRSLVGAD